MIDKAFPEEYKEEAYRSYLGSFGPTGTLEQDDTENWARIVTLSSAAMARDKQLSYNNFSNYMMGMSNIKPDESFTGPGVAYPSCYHDAVARSMHEHWLELISKEDSYVKEEV